MCFLYLNLHRLVGLRRLRLCLKLRLGLCPFLVSEVEQEIYPTSPLTPDPRLRLSARYARCWGHDFGQLCSFLTHAPFFTAYCISALKEAFFATLFCGFVQFYYYFCWFCPPNTLSHFYLPFYFPLSLHKIKIYKIIVCNN